MFDYRLKGWPVPTLTEVIASCDDNARHSGRLLELARKRYRSSMPGSKECREAHDEMTRHQSDGAHWQAMADWYRRNEASEGKHGNGAA